MTIDLALEYIPRRLAELGHKDGFHMRFRHFSMRGEEKIQIAVYNEFFVLIEDVSEVRISSDTGVYDLTATNVNEMQYEHQGAIEIINQSVTITHVRFIQVIPN